MGSRTPLVSIITITRNRGELIHRAIESILKQTYVNFEYIIVDGASVDNTEAVVTSYKDHRINYIRLTENISIPQTINVGFEASHGDYITFLDDDDEYLPAKVEKQVQLIEALPEDYGMVYCWMSYFDDKTKVFLQLHKTELRGYVGEDVIEKPTVSGTPTYLFRRSVFKEMGGWREDIGIISDWDLAARTCQKYKVDYVPESLVNVYVNHAALRMSDRHYYKNDYYRRTIKFHLYFLETYKEILKKYPEKAHLHLYILSHSYYFLSDYKKGAVYQWRLLKCCFSLKNLIFPVYIIYQKLKNGLRDKR